MSAPKKRTIDPADQALNDVVRFRTSAIGRANIARRARAAGLDMSEFIRQAVESATVVRRKDWSDLVSILAQIINLLQVIASQNKGQSHPTEAMHLAAAMVSHEHTLLEILQRKAP